VAQNGSAGTQCIVNLGNCMRPQQRGDLRLGGGQNNSRAVAEIRPIAMN
jgi:hypothetical protein